MLQFLSVDFCPKCTEDRFTLSYEKNTGGRFKFHYHIAPVDEDSNRCFVPPIDNKEEFVGVEHLDVTCSRCGYTWVENTADKSSQVVYYNGEE